MARIALTLVIFPAGALAQPSADSSAESLLRPLTVVLGTSVTQDSNLFRRPEAFAAPRSDVITSSFVGLRLDKSYGQQQVQLSVTQTSNRYDNAKYLDFDPLSYSGTWNWRLGTRLSGKLAANRTETLVPFEDALGLARNVREIRNEIFNFDALIAGSWHLVGGLSRSAQKSQQGTSNQPDFQSFNTELGLKYATAAGNSITALLRTVAGDYLNRGTALVALADNSYTENASELLATWSLTGSSRLNTKLGWVSRDNKDPTRRDFSGQSSDLQYSWTPAGKLSASVTASRKTVPLQDVNASSKVDDTLTLSPTWRISSKSSAFVNMARMESRYQGGTGLAPPRRDSFNTMLVGVDWVPSPKLSLRASLQRQERTSTNALAEFKTNIVTVNANLAF